jgi:DNA-binding CsgD family transcriptional regulator
VEFESGVVHASQLSSRELEILELVAVGLTNREIAQRFWVTETTVKFHLTRIYRKLGVKNRTAAARWLQDRTVAATWLQLRHGPPATPRESRE